MKYNTYAVIMAGGMGERFWPKSRKKQPKQLLSIVSRRSMIQETVDRVKALVPEERILIITNKVQAPLVKKQLPDIPRKNIIPEPLSKNTAPCIALAAKIIQERGGRDTLMVVLPSDHVIKDASRFCRIIKTAVKMAKEGKVLVTLGIKPHFPHTGYGYIKLGRPLQDKYYKVARFTEKPDLKTAKQYIRNGKYLWNSGIFIWRTDAILEEIEKYIPRVLKKLNNYSKVPSVSIDYGVMEKTTRAVVAEADFPWDDVGNWAALEAYFKKDRFGNVFQGTSVAKDINNSIIITDSPLVATLGITDMIVVATKDAVLVCHKKRAQEVKQIVTLLKKGHKRYL